MLCQVTLVFLVVFKYTARAKPRHLSELIDHHIFFVVYIRSGSVLLVVDKRHIVAT